MGFRDMLWKRDCYYLSYYDVGRLKDHNPQNTHLHPPPPSDLRYALETKLLWCLRYFGFEMQVKK